MTCHKPQFRSRHVSKYRIGITLTALFLFSYGIFSPTLPIQAKYSAAASPSNIALSLTGNPSVLPADGGTYSALVLEFKNLTSGAPYIGQSQMTILLTSSSPQTGTVPNNVTIAAGAVYLLVNFTTTTLPGSTVISAIASGYPPATLTVTTKNIGGMPTGLQVFLSPSIIPPNEKMNSTAIVQVVDSAGNPVTLGYPLTVTLSSSNTQVGSVPQSLTIQSGQSFGSATFSPTYVAGSTTITASAGNYTAGSAIMTTIGPIARRLVLSAAPSIVPAITNATATIAIQLQDNNSQTPALAPSPVSVVLTSSNSQIINVPNSIVTIPAGASYASISVQFGGYCPLQPFNVANLTASAQGYVKGSVLLACQNAVVASNGLVEYFAPSTLLPNNETYPNVLVVQLVNSDNGAISPAVAQSPITVYARSSDNATMQVNTGPQVMQAGQSQVEFDVSSTFLPGLVAVTAQSPGYSSYTINLLSFGGAPNALSLQFAPKTLLSDGNAYSSITLGLIGGSGQPAQAPVNTVVRLSSTIPSVGQIQSSVMIPAGQTYARATFRTFGFAGSTLITATTSNYTTTNSTLLLVTKAATNLGLSTSPEIVIANGQQYQNLVIQLQDASGNPEKTDSPVAVQLAIQNSSVGSVSPEIVIPPGSTFAHVVLNSTLAQGSTSVTAFATGFTSGQTVFTSTWLQFQTLAYATVPGLKPGASSDITLKVSSNNYPITGASIHWTVTLGRLTNMVNSTNSTGFGSAFFTSGTVPGAAFIVMNVTKPGYKPLIADTSIRIISPNSTSSSHPKGALGIFTEKIVFIPVWGLIVVAVAVPLAAFFFIRRRAGGGEDDYDEEE